MAKEVKSELQILADTARAEQAEVDDCKAFVVESQDALRDLHAMLRDAEARRVSAKLQLSLATSRLNTTTEHMKRVLEGSNFGF